MSVPTNIVASLFHFEKKTMFEVPMLQKEKMFKLNFKKVFAFLFAFVLCFGCIDIYADDGGYTIDNYTVNATYNSDNTIDVKEVIDVNFSSYRHGIYRNIPETMYINRDESIS